MSSTVEQPVEMWPIVEHEEERIPVVPAELTISRADLIEAADDAIRLARSAEPMLAAHAITALQSTARTVETIVFNGWKREGCGCLVGSTFPAMIHDWLAEDIGDGGAGLPTGLYMTGVYFNDVLAEVLHDRGQLDDDDSRCPPALVRVVD